MSILDAAPAQGSRRMARASAALPQSPDGMEAFRQVCTVWLHKQDASSSFKTLIHLGYAYAGSAQADMRLAHVTGVVPSHTVFSTCVCSRLASRRARPITSWIPHPIDDQLHSLPSHFDPSSIRPGRLAGPIP